MDRLRQALELLGYQQNKNVRDRHNLLRAIELFAAMSKDEDLESACALELERLRDG